MAEAVLKLKESREGDKSYQAGVRQFITIANRRLLTISQIAEENEKVTTKDVRAALENLDGQTATIFAKLDKDLVTADDIPALVTAAQNQFDEVVTATLAIIEAWSTSRHLSGNEQKKEASAKLIKSLKSFKDLQIESYIDRDLQIRDKFLQDAISDPSFSKLGYIFKVDEWREASITPGYIAEYSSKVAEYGEEIARAYVAAEGVTSVNDLVDKTLELKSEEFAENIADDIYAMVEPVMREACVADDGLTAALANAKVASQKSAGRIIPKIVRALTPLVEEAADEAVSEIA